MTKKNDSIYETFCSLRTWEYCWRQLVIKRERYHLGKSYLLNQNIKVKCDDMERTIILRLN